MPTWLPTAIVSVVLTLVNLSALFFFNLVPDISDRKRYLKQAGSWAVDIFILGGQGLVLYSLTLTKGPVTPSFVLDVAFSMGCLLLCVILIGFQRLILSGLMPRYFELFKDFAAKTDWLEDNAIRHVDFTGGLIGIAEQHVAELERHKEALTLLASDSKLSVKTAQALRAILDGNSGVSTETKLLKIGSKNSVEETRQGA